MLYKALFLPVDKPLEDGCDCVFQSGEHYIYDESKSQFIKAAIKRAELFLVSYEFNQLIVVGKPSPEALWLKNGMNVKEVDCELYMHDKYGWVNIIRVEPNDLKFVLENKTTYWRIKCPTCGVLH